MMHKMAFNYQTESSTIGFDRKTKMLNMLLRYIWIHISNRSGCLDSSLHLVLYEVPEGLQEHRSLEICYVSGISNS